MISAIIDASLAPVYRAVHTGRVRPVSSLMVRGAP